MSVLQAVLFALSIFTYSTLWAEGKIKIEYLDELNEVLPDIINAAFVFDDKAHLLKPVLKSARHSTARFEFIQTDPRFVPYDKAMAAVEIMNASGKRIYICMKSRRGASVSWIDDRLLVIQSQVSRIAATTSVFDVKDGIWLYRKAMRYSYPSVESNDENK